MADCATYEPPFGAQLGQGGATGPVDCTAWAASRAIAFATCGAKVPSGRTIRLLSNEPKPNPSSPGLNLRQVADVMWDDYRVYVDVRVDNRAIAFADYEKRRMAGQGCLLSIGYGPIADSPQDAGRGFRGNHTIFESHSTTIESLADGRAPGVWKYDGNVYGRSMIARAGSQLDLGGGRKPQSGRVWAAFTRDVVPEWRARVPSGAFWSYHVEGGVITGRHKETTGGFSADCTPPRVYQWPAEDTTAYLVRLLSGSRAGSYISAVKYADEVP